MSELIPADGKFHRLEVHQGFFGSTLCVDGEVMLISTGEIYVQGLSEMVKLYSEFPPETPIKLEAEIQMQGEGHTVRNLRISALYPKKN